MNVALSEASASNTDRIAEILTESRKKYLPYAPFPYSEREIRSWVRDVLLPSGGITLASSGGEIFGVLAVSEADGGGWIDQMYIAPMHVGRGIGGVLIAHAIKSLPRPIRLYTFQENQKARGFYEHHGFCAISFTDGERNEEQCPDVLYELV